MIDPKTNRLSSDTLTFRFARGQQSEPIIRSDTGKNPCTPEKHMFEVTPYKVGELIIVITKDNGEANMGLTSFPHCLDYVECAEDYYPIDDWGDCIANGTILVRATEEKIKRLSDIVNMINRIYVHKVGHVSYDEDRDCDSHSSGIERKNVVNDFFYLVGDAVHISEVIDKKPDEILSTIQRDCSDSFDPEYGGTWAIMTEEAYREEASEKERKRLEETASWFANQCGHAVGSIEYVHAIQEAIERSQRDMEHDCYGERRMERAAAARFCGQSSEDYWSDEDYIRNQHEENIFLLANVLQWLEINCPLLMLKVQEKELALS